MLGEQIHCKRVVSEFVSIHSRTSVTTLLTVLGPRATDADIREWRRWRGLCNTYTKRNVEPT